MSDIEFHQLIKKSFKNNIPSVSGKYPQWNLIRKQSGNFLIDKNDIESFQRLYTVKPDGNTGNGEISFLVIQLSS